MVEYFGNSIFVIFLIKILQKTYIYYTNSVFGVIVESIKNAYRNSRTKKILRNYIHKDAYFRYSITYRIIDKISKILALVCCLIHNAALYILNGSDVFEKVRSISKTKGELIFLYTGFFTAAAVLIYLLCCMCFLTIESINVLVSIGLMIISFACMCIGNVLEYIKNSFVFKAVAYFFED